jgi:GNAT superfamily N-acetyltransferase
MTKAFTLPDGSALSLKTVTADDDSFLLSVYASTRAEELAQVEWEPGHQEAFVKWQFEMQRREYETRFPDAEYDVIEIDGKPAGRIWIGRTKEQIRLLDIALLPEFQNRGAGTLLIRNLIEEARATNHRLSHALFILNNDAGRFYEKLGFVVTEDLGGGYKNMVWQQSDA